MRYQHINQKPYCCVGACLEMVLNRRNIPTAGQVAIACELGLTVPQEYSKLYPQAQIGAKPSASYGTQIQQPQYSLNKFFERHQIPLKGTFYPLTKINNIKDFLTKNTENDILVCCHCGTLYNSPPADWGHMLIIENLVGAKVTLIDPSLDKAYETVPLQNLINAIKYHGIENGAGFYVISNQ